MPRFLTSTFCLLTILSAGDLSSGFGGTIVFYEKNFPSIENGAISRSALEDALAPLKPEFVDLAGLKKGDAISEGDLLVLPYGSALPADAWETIGRHIERGNLLVLGMRLK